MQVPYATQLYSDGSHCKRDADPEAGDAPRPPILRRVELRLMCSPDSQQHVIVAEIQQCIYTVELYLPQLCALPGFGVELPAELLQLGGSLGGGGGGRRVPVPPGGGGEGGATAGAASGAASGTASTTEGDEYLDAEDEEAGDDVAGEGGDEEALYSLPTQTQGADDDPYVDPDEL